MVINERALLYPTITLNLTVIFKEIFFPCICKIFYGTRREKCSLNEYTDI